MKIKKYTASSIQEALQMVREELGPNAAVLRTRQVSQKKLLPWFGSSTRIEVTASSDVSVPSRLPVGMAAGQPGTRRRKTHSTRRATPTTDVRPTFTTAANKTVRNSAGQQRTVPTPDHNFEDKLRDLRAASSSRAAGELPEVLYSAFTRLIEADVSEDLARVLIDRLKNKLPSPRTADPQFVESQLVATVEDEINVTGGIQVVPQQCRLVALVGPTGVGKTTTIAKLAANFRLRDKRKVALITVDTYRIAAVDQLQTYADIMGLPLHVVSTPRELRTSINELQDYELVLMDTAGRSPRDDIKLQELKSMLSEANADEVHLVLSAAASTANLMRSAERFAEVGTNSLLLTKLDETVSLGHVLPLLKNVESPLSYLTDGQNVPDDIEVATAAGFVRRILSDA